jgi:multidrug efflux system outer membrane protein
MTPSRPQTADEPRALAHWAAGVLCLALGACASLSRPAAGLPDVVVPVAWSAPAPSDLGRATGAQASPRGDADSRTPARTATSLVDWWQRFDDPLLSSLVNQALQANTDVRSAEAALRQSRALSDVAAAGRLPGVGSSASVQRSRSGDNPAGNLFKAGFDASWEPDVFGAQRATADATEADSKASAARLGDV